MKFKKLLFSFLFKIPTILSQQENIKHKCLSTVLFFFFSFFSFFFSYLSKSVLDAELRCVEMFIQYFFNYW